MPEPQVNMTPAQLQQMMEGVVARMKEPTEAEKVKMDAERREFLRRENETLELAKAEIERKERRRRNCAHFHRFKGQTFHGWNGQVHGDGLVHPVCKFCHTEWPPFSAKLLPDEGRQGVNFEDWNECHPTILSELHKRTFPKGCPRQDCFVCHPKKS